MWSLHGMFLHWIHSLNLKLTFCGKNESTLLWCLPQSLLKGNTAEVWISDSCRDSSALEWSSSLMKFCCKGSVHLSAFCVWVLCYLLGLETEKGEILANMQCVRNGIPASALMSSKWPLPSHDPLLFLSDSGWRRVCIQAITSHWGRSVWAWERQNQNNHKEDRLGELILGR